MLPDFYERPLKYVVGVFVGAGELADVPVEALAVFLYKKIEGKLLFAFSPVKFKYLLVLQNASVICGSLLFWQLQLCLRHQGRMLS